MPLSPLMSTVTSDAAAVRASSSTYKFKGWITINGGLSLILTFLKLRSSKPTTRSPGKLL